MKIKYVIIFILIFFYMTTILWGNLPMSQDDNRTIAEYVADMIAEHNESADAHNLPGQSLYQHKANDIIDHPAGSVKNDKNSFNQFYYNLLFSDFNYWSKSRFSYNSNDSSIYWNNGNPNETAYFYKFFDYNSLPFDSVTSRYFEIFYETESQFSSNVSVNIGFSLPALYTDLTFTGFKQIGSKLYAHHFISTGGYVDEEIISDLNDQPYNLRLRVFYSASEKKIYWYVGGEIVFEYDVSNDLDSVNTDSQIGVNCFSGSTPLYDFQVAFLNPILSVDFTY